MDSKTEAVFQRGYDFFVKKQYEQSLPVLLKAAKAGHPRAQALLGRTYQEGLGVPVDYKQAAVWFGQAAAQGHRASQYGLGNLYFEGEGVPQDRTKAITLYRQSAEQGYDQAEFILGLAYEFGWGGLPRNRQIAIRWLSKAGVHRNGQAGWIATWLEKPDTPHFRDEVQLGKYIGAKIDRWAAAQFGGGGGPPTGSDKCDWRCAQMAEKLERAGRGESAIRCRGGELEHCNP